MSGELEGLDLLADLGTLVNTGATAKGIAIQNQMLFDAMTPEQQERVIEAAKARIAIAEEKKAEKKARRRGFILFLAGIACLFLILTAFLHP
jgi:hypothetical protein